MPTPDRHVTTAEEGAARIAGYIFGDGNPEHNDSALGGTAMTALATAGFIVPECTRIATDLLGWAQGNQFRVNATNGNFICLAAPLYAALGMAYPSGDFYFHALTAITPTRKQVEAWTASLVETEGGANGSGKLLDEFRTDTVSEPYSQRLSHFVTTLNTQNLGASISGKSVVATVSKLDAFPLPMISDARYPGTAGGYAAWPDSGGGGGGGGTGIGKPHIMLIPMENRGYDSTTTNGRYVVGHSEWPKVNNTVFPQAVRFSKFYAAYGPNGHGSPATTGSHPNYPPLVGGSNFTVVNDSVPANPGTGLTNTILFDQLNAAGISWAAYAEDINTDLTVDKTEGDGLTYIARHNAPIADFAHFNVSPHLSNVKDAGSTRGFGTGTPSWPTLIADLNAADPPAFVWFCPTAHNQGHGNGPTTTAWAGDAHADPDNFVAKLIADVQATSWYANGGNIIFWWDDGADTHFDPNVMSGNGQTITFIVSAKAAASPSRTNATPMNSFGILHDIEQAYGLSFLNHAGDAANTTGAGALFSVLDLGGGGGGGDTTAPAIPVGLVGTPGDTTASLSWGTVGDSDLAGYRLYRDGLLVFTGLTPSFLDTGLTDGTTYSYQVSAFDTSGNESAPSTAVQVTPIAPVGPPPDTTAPDTPTDLNGTPTMNSVALSWTGSLAIDVAHYRVYRGGLLIAEVNASVLFYEDTGLDSSTIYSYRVSAVDGAGNESAPTDAISVETLFGTVDPPPITQQTTHIVSTLGCPEAYGVFVAARSGHPLLTELPASSIAWSRVTDDVSEATIGLDLANGFEECCRAINGLGRYMFEIAIYRQGILVWTGPVVDITVQGGIQIRAEDKMSWLKVRAIHNHIDYPDPGVDVATIFNAVIADAMAPDNVPGLSATATGTGVRAAREYLPNPPQNAFDAVQELSRSGVDYTMIGPTMVAGSFVVPTPPIALLTDQSVTELPQYELLGANFASKWIVTGAPGDDSTPGIIASYGGVDVNAGLVERIGTEDSIKDQISLNQNAKSRWELTNGPAVGQAILLLDPEAPLPIELCVPGATVRLAIGETCFPLTGTFRMKSLAVTVTSGQGGPAERVELTVEPLGTELVT